MAAQNTENTFVASDPSLPGGREAALRAVEVKQYPPATPKLRFLEFEGKWMETTLGNLIQIISGFAFKSIFFSDSGQPLITPKNFTKDGKADFNTGNTKFTTEEVDEKYVCKSGDLLVLLTDLTPSCELLGKPIVLSDEDGEVLLNQRIINVSVDKARVYKEFLANVLLTEKYHRRIKETATGTTVRHSSNKIILDYQTEFPTLPEQQKIAAFLSAVDEKIQQLTKKKELLEQYKKGVMQQLFSKKIRFAPSLKDFKGELAQGMVIDLAANYPDWEEKQLGEVLTIGSGRDYKHLNPGKIPVFGTGGYMLSVNEKLYSGETVFIGRKGTIDKPFYFNGDFWTVDTLFYTHKFKNVLPKFIYAIFQQVNWKSHNEASGVPSLSKSTIEKIKFDFPVVEEQQKIANYLSAIDTKIEMVNQQITQTQTFKKGLLQQMFV